ncbi:MAG: pyridoxal phosphate-dependent class II aminotransferase [Deltaproteobacteria bacterium]|nr:pyridoxal phosphate-dependent class II aminotransferase [Deltaproteobacteria bacterium]MBW2067444.1 pyridoxal phosphate-dependent class II aminotransferase [Deltaproteobacteria bacterium]
MGKEQPIHGGNIYEVCRKLGCSFDEILDLSASINPLGPPEGLHDELRDCYKQIVHYPDIHNDELIQALSEFHGLPEDYFVVGNGSTELLFWLPYAMDWNRVAIVLPTFSEYLTVFKNKGLIVRSLLPSSSLSFQPSVEQLDALIHSVKPEALFLTHPGSPSGVPLSPEVISYVVSTLESSDITWVIDEVFVDFKEELSLKKHLLLCGDAPGGLVIIRSLTKFYALPGLRLGYIMAPIDIAKRLRQYVPPWSVNVFAQRAGIFCLKAEDFRKKTRKFFDEERARLLEILKGFSWLEIFPSVANYILLELQRSFPMNSFQLHDYMLSKHKILIRNCANFAGLNDRYVRIAISSRENNDRWMEALKEASDQRTSCS